MGGFQRVRLRHKASTGQHSRSKRGSSSCSSGGFYTNPTTGDSINALKPLNITWDASCLDTDLADIYLYAPTTSTTRLHIWEGVDFTKGYYNATLMPRWWNSTSSIQLQFSIVGSSSAPFLSTLPAGPVFTATYSKPSSGTPASANTELSDTDTGITQVSSLTSSAGAKRSISSGDIAAAVLVPILVVAGLIAGYVWWSRKRAQEKSKRWSQVLDKRMSVISQEWKSTTPAGASAAIRQSMAVDGAFRASSLDFGDVRPPSSYVDSGQAGVGAMTGVAVPGVGGFIRPLPEDGQMTQLRNSVLAQVNARRSRTMSLEDPKQRVSRVSFADGTSPARVSRVSFAEPTIRPSIERRRSAYSTNTASRAFHTAITAPPLPTRSDSDDSYDATQMSPRQSQGPLTLTAEDINAMPALSMMRTGRESDALQSAGDEDDFMFPQMPVPQIPTLEERQVPSMAMPVPEPYQSPMGPMAMAMPANMMSPDEMLRAYAAARQAGGSSSAAVSTSPLAYPTPLAQPTRYNGAGMRAIVPIGDSDDDQLGAPPIPGPGVAR